MTGALALTILTIIDYCLNMITLLVIGSIIISWLNADPSNPIVQMITRLTEPIYRPFRRLFGRMTGPIDLAPLCVLILVVAIQKGFGFYMLRLSADLQSRGGVGL